jgi:hypothetical protein
MNFRRIALGLLMLVSACGSDPADIPSQIPPEGFDPTHHAVIEGVVTNAAGQPLDSVGVGVPLMHWPSIPPARRITARGSGTTGSDGLYRFEVVAEAPPAADGSADIFVRVVKIAPPGGTVKQDSLRVTARFTPLGVAPLTTTADTVRLSQ